MSALVGMDRSAPDSSSEAESSFYRPGDLIAGRYLVRELIGSGPLGLVYRAENRNTGAILALRMIWPELLPDDAARGLFLKRTIRARTVQNRYVAPLFEAFIDEIDGQVACLLAMKDLPGPTLASRVTRRLRHGVPLLAVEAQPIVSQLGVGLSAIHAAGMVHGNINSNNVFFVGDEIRIGDLGVASALPANVVALAEQHAGKSLGRAPESAAGRAPSPASDVYALAVVTARMLGLLAARSREEIPVPSSVRSVLRRALSQHPRDRYADIDTFAGALVMAFERADQRAAVGLRAVEPHDGDDAPRSRASHSEHSDAIVGALESPPEGSGPVRRQRRSGAASVVVAPDAFDSHTPVTLPRIVRGDWSGGPRAGRRERTAPAAAAVAAPAQPIPAVTKAGAAPPPSRQRPSPIATAPNLREAVGRVRPRARVPLALVLLLMVMVTALSVTIVRNVVVARFEERMALARVEKAALLRRVSARPPAERPAELSAADPSPQPR